MRKHEETTIKYYKSLIKSSSDNQEISENLDQIYEKACQSREVEQ